ncbi:MAG: ExeA family protein [Wenzhouxiangellaceae bacterium]
MVSGNEAVLNEVTELGQYLRYFGLNEPPFAITPDPRYLYLSRRHQEGLAHLLYGVGQGGSGGFVQLTGEVGTGKTMLCRSLLEQVPERTQVALILNPMLSPRELVATICDELNVAYPDDASSKRLVDHLNRHLLSAHASGERVVVVIDEAQNMSREALEQVRLLTNLETATDKLLQIVLLGQPELRTLLARSELRQLSQRITARYHLEPLDVAETGAYVRHRLAVAGAPRCPFSKRALRAVYRHSKGVPRLINIIADRALMGAFAADAQQVGAALVRQAAREVRGDLKSEQRAHSWIWPLAAAAAALLTGLVWWQWPSPPAADEAQASVATTTEQTTVAIPPLPVAPAAAAMWASYADLWRTDVAVLTSACEQGQSQQFLCLRQSGNWRRLRQLSLPVVLIFSDGSELLLIGLNQQQALIDDGLRQHSLPLATLEQHWLGDYWVVAPGRSGALQEGDKAAEVHRLKALAAALEGLPYTGPVDERFDPALTHWVKTFQNRHGLSADGIVGPATRIYLAAEAVTQPHLVEEW